VRLPKLNASDDASLVKAREVMKDRAEKEATNLQQSDLAYRLGTGWPVTGRLSGATPSAPTDPVQGEVLLADFRSTYTALRTYGVDADKASDLAVQRLQSTWGVSQAGGNQVMKYPPESHYPDIDGSRDWIGQDLNDFITSQIGSRVVMPGVSRSGALTGKLQDNWTLDRLISDGRTSAEIDSKQSPSYMVAVKKPDGTTQILDKRVAFDPSDYRARHSAELERRRQVADFVSALKAAPVLTP
jgi:hypothetical protein